MLTTRNASPTWPNKLMADLAPPDASDLSLISTTEVSIMSNLRLFEPR